MPGKSIMNRNRVLVSWTLRLISAVILLQTLFFKFTGAEESVYIFTRLGMEPAGRIGTGIAELIAAVMLLVPASAAFGAVLTLGLMSGAIFSHLTDLGIEVLGDGGYLFSLAAITWAASAGVAWLHRAQLLTLARHAVNRLSALTGIGKRSSGVSF